MATRKQAQRKAVPKRRGVFAQSFLPVAAAVLASAIASSIIAGLLAEGAISFSGGGLCLFLVLPFVAAGLPTLAAYILARMELHEDYLDVQSGVTSSEEMPSARAKIYLRSILLSSMVAVVSAIMSAIVSGLLAEDAISVDGSVVLWLTLLVLVTAGLSFGGARIAARAERRENSPSGPVDVGSAGEVSSGGGAEGEPGVSAGVGSAGKVSLSGGAEGKPSVPADVAPAGEGDTRASSAVTPLLLAAACFSLLLGGLLGWVGGRRA